MQQMANAPYEAHAFVLPEAFSNLDYDAYRLIQFSPDAAGWSDSAAGYRVQAFHLGGLYPEPVKVFEVNGGKAHALAFSPDDFD